MNGVRRCSIIVFVVLDGRFRSADLFGSARGGSTKRTRKQSMLRTIALGAALAFCLATNSNAAVLPVQAGPHSDLTIKVAEGCGPGWWRGPGGRCHPMARARLCPPGFHIGP